MSIRYLFTLATGFILVFAASAWAGTFRDDFEDGNLEGWTQPFGNWEVKDGVLVTNNNADFTTIDLGKETWGDYTITFDGKVKSHQGQCCIAGSIRYQQKDMKMGWAYYAIAKTSFMERIEASVYIDPDQYFGMIRNPDFLLELDRWYNFKVSINGSKFDFHLDGELVISTDWSNQPLSKNGKIELWTRYPGEYWFDNVAITGPDIPDAGPSGFAVNSSGKLATTWGQIKL